MGNQDTDVQKAIEHARLNLTRARRDPQWELPAMTTVLDCVEALHNDVQEMKRPTRLGPGPIDLKVQEQAVEKLADAASKLVGKVDRLETRAIDAKVDRKGIEKRVKNWYCENHNTNYPIQVNEIIYVVQMELERIKRRVEHNVLWEVRREELSEMAESVLMGAVESAFTSDPPGPPSPPVPPRHRPVS